MEKNLKTDLKKSPQIEDIFAFKLSGRYFTKGVNIISSKKIDGGRFEKKIYCFDIDLEINPDFVDCDLKDKIELFSKENGKIIFRGIIKESFVNGIRARVIAQDISLKMDYFSIGLECSRSLGPRDLFSLLISPFEELKLICNFSDIPDTSERDFIVIVPVKNLVLKENIHVGDTEFYNNFNTIDDKIIRKSNFGKSIPEWKSFPTRAKVIVKASEFRLALNQGYNKISTAIDLIAFRSDLSFPRLKIRGSSEYPHFYYQVLVAEVTIPTWVYCRENDTDLWAIFNLNFLKGDALKPEYNQHEYFNLVNQLFSRFLHKENIGKNDRNILIVLHWLRRAIQSGDNKDKMLDLWTAMDFLISGTRAKSLFCDEQIDSIRQLVNQNIESLDLTIEQKEVLLGRIGKLNEAPLMTRINTLKQKVGI